MKMITGVSKMCCDGVIQYLEKEKVSILIKDRHTCLDLNDRNMYVLKKGIVKVSLIMQMSVNLILLIYKVRMW